MVADLISPTRIINAIRLIYQALLSYGYARPKIAVAGLNPHAGEGGLFGREEIDLIQPAIQCANVPMTNSVFRPLDRYHLIPFLSGLRVANLTR
jgi:4-hydroxy-L-threonine phosphate dehydrogenase PdxA